MELNTDDSHGRVCSLFFSLIIARLFFFYHPLVILPLVASSFILVEERNYL